MAINKGPLISVIVPIYNVEKYVCQCIDSIIAQTYKDIEIILVDDGSPDNCGAICDEYASKDNRIKVIHKENGGLSSARNAGIDICSGEYISFIDSDDFVSPYFIEILYKGIVFNESDIASLKHGIYFIDGDDENVVFAKNADDCTIIDIAQREIIKMLLYQGVSNGAPWRLYKRKIFKELRFPVGYLFEDVGTTHKTFMLAEKIALVDASIYAYRVRKDSIVHMDFSPKKMDAIPISKSMMNDVLKYDQTLKKAAMSRAFSINYQIFLQAPFDDIESRKKLWTEIKKYRKTVLTDMSPKLRFKNRAGAAISYLGMDVAWKIGRIMTNK